VATTWTRPKDQWRALGEFDRAHKIKLVIDEWGTWHPPGTEINKRHLYEQMSTVEPQVTSRQVACTLPPASINPLDMQLG
jgi:hypothetical protein